jgi:hypothetical protein
MIEHLPGKCEALNSNHSTAKKKEKRKRKGEGREMHKYRDSKY